MGASAAVKAARAEPGFGSGAVCWIRENHGSSGSGPPDTFAPPQARHRRGPETHRARPAKERTMAVKVQVIFYSTYGHVFQLAEAVAEGAREVAGADVQVLRVPETLPPDVLAKMGATDAQKAFAHVPVADPRRLAE